MSTPLHLFEMMQILSNDLQMCCAGYCKSRLQLVGLGINNVVISIMFAVVRKLIRKKQNAVFPDSRSGPFQMHYLLPVPGLWKSFSAFDWTNLRHATHLQTKNRRHNRSALLPKSQIEKCSQSKKAQFHHLQVTVWEKNSSLCLFLTCFPLQSHNTRMPLSTVSPLWRGASPQPTSRRRRFVNHQIWTGAAPEQAYFPNSEQRWG